MTLDSTQLIAGAEPIFHVGDTIGCLVLHGFMASPNEVGWLGQHLIDNGRTVYIPRMTGHGINPEHMSRLRWEDWYAQALDGYHILKQICQKVIVCGHSMGGLLASQIASFKPVDGLVVAASPYTVPDRLMGYGKLIAPFMPYTQHPTEADYQAMVRAEQARRDEAEVGRVHYAKWSSRAVYELYRGIHITRERLAHVNAPTLLLYATDDQTVTLEDMARMAQGMTGATVTQHTLNAGGHLVYMDVGRDEACQITGNFVTGLT